MLTNFSDLRKKIFPKHSQLEVRNLPHFKNYNVSFLDYKRSVTFCEFLTF